MQKINSSISVSHGNSKRVEKDVNEKHVSFVGVDAYKMSRYGRAAGATNPEDDISTESIISYT